MTFVGKILVVVITALSLLFLGISVVVYNTEKDWKNATAEAKKKYDEVKKSHDATVAETAVAQKVLEEAKKQHARFQNVLEDRLNVLNAEMKRAEEETAQTRIAFTKAQEKATATQDEQTAVKQATDQLREQKARVENQANAYRARQAELSDQIRLLNRMLETATKNAKDLRERVAASQ
jgi:hypothetical protein